MAPRECKRRGVLRRHRRCRKGAVGYRLQQYVRVIIVRSDARYIWRNNTGFERKKKDNKDSNRNACCHEVAIHARHLEHYVAVRLVMSDAATRICLSVENRLEVSGEVKPNKARKDISESPRSRQSKPMRFNKRPRLESPAACWWLIGLRRIRWANVVGATLCPQPYW